MAEIYDQDPDVRAREDRVVVEERAVVTEVETDTDERSLGQLFSELARELSTLVQKEIALAKTEMSKALSKASKQIAYVAAGGALAYAGLLLILAGIAILIGDAIDNLWLAALLVGLIVAAIGGWLAYSGLQTLKKIDFVPETTIETLKEDKEWAQKQMK